MAPEGRPFEENHIQYGPIDEWECANCLKIIPSALTPILNGDACTCFEAGPFVQEHSGPQQGEAFEQPGYQYPPPLGATYHPPPQSYASSSVSASCPEGPEGADPNGKVPDGYFSLVVDASLDEVQHRPIASEPCGLSLQMWRFLLELENNRPGYAAEPASPGARFARDVHMRPPMRGSTNYRRKPSYQSVLSSSSEEPAFVGCEVDPMAGIGTWDETRACMNSGDEYPLTMSGLVEYPPEG